jgi:hypothetical protein
MRHRDRIQKTGFRKKLIRYSWTGSRTVKLQPGKELGRFCFQQTLPRRYLSLVRFHSLFFLSFTRSNSRTDFEPIVEIHEVEKSLLGGLEDLKLEIRRKAEITRQNLGLFPTALDDLSDAIAVAVEGFIEDRIASCKDQSKSETHPAKSRTRSRTNSSLSKQLAPTPEIRVSSDPTQPDQIIRAPSPRWLQPRTSRSNSVKSTKSTRTQESMKSNRLLIPTTPNLLGHDHLSPSSATSSAAWSPISSDQSDMSSFASPNFQFSPEIDSLSSSINHLSPWSNLNSSPLDGTPVHGTYATLDIHSNPGSELVPPAPSSSMSAFDIQHGPTNYLATTHSSHIPFPSSAGGYGLDQLTHQDAFGVQEFQLLGDPDGEMQSP